MKKRLLPGLITLLAAQPALALDLMETYEKALSYDSGIASAMAQFQAQQATSDVSKSALLPKISAVGSASYTSFEPRNIPGGANADELTRQLFSGDSYRTYRYGVELTQPLFRAQDWFSYEASQFQAEAAEAQYNLAQQQLILDVATAYFDVLRAKDTVTTAKATETAIQRQYEQAQERFDVGLIAITEVYEARASYDDARSQRIAADNDLNVAKEQLARLTGEYPDAMENLRQNFPLGRPEPMDPTSWEATAVEQNWSIQAALRQLNASEASLKAAKSGHLPTLELSASYQESSLENALFTQQEGNQSIVSLSLTIPFYTGGGTSAVVCLPDWPWWNRHPLNCLEAPEEEEFVEKRKKSVDASKRKKQPLLNSKNASRKSKRNKLRRIVSRQNVLLKRHERTLKEMLPHKQSVMQRKQRDKLNLQQPKKNV